MFVVRCQRTESLTLTPKSALSPRQTLRSISPVIANRIDSFQQVDIASFFPETVTQVRFRPVRLLTKMEGIKSHGRLYAPCHPPTRKITNGHFAISDDFC